MPVPFSSEIAGSRGGISPGRPKFVPDTSPIIRVEINGDPMGKRGDISSFMLTDDVRSLWDPWQFTMPNPDGSKNYLLKSEWVPIKIYHSDPAVQDGAERLWLRGIIAKVGQKESGQGHLLTFSGYDNGYYLSSHAPYFVRLRVSWGTLARKMIDPSWGISLIFDGNFNSQIRQGRIDAQTSKYLKEAKAEAMRLSQGRADVGLSLFAQFKAPLPVIQTMPGQTVGDILTRYARLANYPDPGGLVNISADGNISIFQPDYTKKPDYVFHYHRPNDPLSKYNNVKQPEYQRDAEPLYNDVSCVGTRIVGFTMPNQTADPNEDKFAGRYADRKITSPVVSHGKLQGPGLFPAPLRRFSFMDPDRLNKKQAYLRARWQFNQGVYARETLTYVHEGHSQIQPGGEAIPFVANTMAEVHDSVNDVEGNMYVARVQPYQDLNGGSYTVITIKPPNLLAA